MWIKREISNKIKEIVNQRPVIIITGCRQTGKTSLLKKLFPHSSFVSLDVPQIAEQADHSGEEFLRKYRPPLIVDEIQYSPGLFRHLKKEVDANREKNGLFCLTGSQKFSLMEGVTESLAGRAAVLDLHSLSLKELENWSGKSADKDRLLEWMFLGGYPELHAKGLDAERFYSDYLATYIERDVRQLLEIKNLRDFDRFMRLAAIRTGQLLSFNSFAGDLGLSPNTVKNWFSVLEASNIVYFLEPYYQNLGKRIVKTAKLYFLDTGLAAYLAGFRSAQDLRNSELLGAFYETLVLGQILRKYSNQGKTAPIYFYRDHYGHEVDFIIPVGEKLKLIECKWSETPTPHQPGFIELNKVLGPSKILSQAIVTPLRDTNRMLPSSTVYIDNAVDLQTVD